MLPKPSIARYFNATCNINERSVGKVSKFLVREYISAYIFLFSLFSKIF